ncbi:MAG: hypothetical protein AAGJ38_03410, partial [Planctomycetota bacterium]
SRPTPHAIAPAARAAAKLVEMAESEYAALRGAAQAGSCVEACQQLARQLAERLEDLSDAHQQLIERGGLKPGLPDAEPATPRDLANPARWAKLVR